MSLFLSMMLQLCEWDTEEPVFIMKLIITVC